MQKEAHTKGEALFQKGDTAEKIYFIQTGRVVIPELQRELTAGTVFGEVGVFSHRRTRSASAICVSDGIIYSIHIDKVLELYYQNPQFGFFIARLLCRYASENVDTIVAFQNRSVAL
jgi:CRP/FNR family transcriptional regulator, cyclic AMP receptor protein